MTDQKIMDKCPVCDCFNWKVVAVALVIVTSILAINWLYNYLPSPYSYDETVVVTYYQGYYWDDVNGTTEVIYPEHFTIPLKWHYGFNETWVLASYPQDIIELEPYADDVVDFNYVEHENTSWYYNYTSFALVTIGIGEGELVCERYINDVYQDNYKVKIIVVGDLLWE